MCSRATSQKIDQLNVILQYRWKKFHSTYVVAVSIYVDLLQLPIRQLFGHQAGCDIARRMGKLTLSLILNIKPCKSSPYIECLSFYMNCGGHTALCEWRIGHYGYQEHVHQAEGTSTQKNYQWLNAFLKVRQDGRRLGDKSLITSHTPKVRKSCRSGGRTCMYHNTTTRLRFEQSLLGSKVIANHFSVCVADRKRWCRNFQHILEAEQVMTFSRGATTPSFMTQNKNLRDCKLRNEQAPQNLCHDCQSMRPRWLPNQG